jgi:hypothetical protein
MACILISFFPSQPAESGIAPLRLYAAALPGKDSFFLKELCAAQWVYSQGRSDQLSLREGRPNGFPGRTTKQSSFFTTAKKSRMLRSLRSLEMTFFREIKTPLRFLELIAETAHKDAFFGSS